MVGSRFYFQDHAVLGTVIDLTVQAEDRSMADRAAESFFDEVTRLQTVFSAFDSRSELSRWRRGGVSGGVTTSAEFTHLMGEALRWQHLTNGLFNPLAGELSARWEAAATADRTPDPDELQQIADAIGEPRFQILDGQPIATGDCSQLNLNAIAKGFIVDQAITRISDQGGGVDEILINAGGDIRHHGAGSMRIGIENPQLPFDNEPPLTVIEITNEAVATSGASRRGFTVEGERHSHIVDPRTGQAASGSTATVVARSAVAADVVATAAAIVEPGEALDLIDRVSETEPLAALIIGQDSTLYRSPQWTTRFG